ncbi:MAG: PD-(D/E)XK nuclease domain-containing protein, partial [Gammaproteobacteria bacterium]|nr:PD-(D/E)XK nuclease domain-containing protein [Gammaproteobacteria bacterium]
GHYASVIFTYFMSLGFPCIAEDTTNKGRIDLTIKLPKRTVIIEFKVDSKESPLAQVKQKQYFQKYQHEQKDIFIVGICFDSNEKNISDFEWEKV